MELLTFVSDDWIQSCFCVPPSPPCTFKIIFTLVFKAMLKPTEECSECVLWKAGVFPVVHVTNSLSDNQTQIPQEIALHDSLSSTLPKSARARIDFSSPRTDEMACIGIPVYCTETELLTWNWASQGMSHLLLSTEAAAHCTAHPKTGET